MWLVFLRVYTCKIIMVNERDSIITQLQQYNMNMYMKSQVWSEGVKPVLHIVSPLLAQ